MGIRCHICDGLTVYAGQLVRGTEDRRCTRCGHTCEYVLAYRLGRFAALAFGAAWLSWPQPLPGCSRSERPEELYLLRPAPSPVTSHPTRKSQRGNDQMNTTRTYQGAGR